MPGAAEETSSRIVAAGTGGHASLVRRHGCLRNGAEPGEASVSTRQSRGLEEFFGYIRDPVGPDDSRSGRSHAAERQLHHESGAPPVLRRFPADSERDVRRGGRRPIRSTPDASNISCEQALDYPEGHFDGVLIWDVLEYLEPALLTAVVERLQHDRAAEELHAGVFPLRRQAGCGAVLHVPHSGGELAAGGAARDCGRPAQLFNNRSLEKLFGRYESVKFFLTRERLSEVIIKV